MNNNEVLGLDVGERKIGIARVSTLAKIPEPLGVIPHDGSVFEAIRSYIDEYSADILVIGMPRNMNGELTKQSEYVQEFINGLQKVIDVPIKIVDETLSTVLSANLSVQWPGKTDDELAACIILEQYLHSDLVQ